MWNKALTLLTALLMLVLAGCVKDGGVCLSSAGKATTVERKLGSFEKMDVDRNIEIEFYPNSTENRVEVTGGKNLVDGCTTEVRENTLYITNTNKCNWLRDYRRKIKMKVYCTAISQLRFSGSADFTCMDTLRTDVFTFLGWDGSGDVRMKLEVKEAYIKLNTGTSDVYLSGKSDLLYYYSLTTGYIYGRDFITREGHVEQSGYGDFHISPSIALKGTITRSGNVYCPQGIPTDISISGSGNLVNY
ncbi:MAG: DUF2807 domain-containing protein [Bacteroidota bacterium]